jgi:hypothetical protein
MADEHGEGVGDATQRSPRVEVEIQEERDEGAGILAAARRSREKLRGVQVFLESSWS